MCVVIDTIIYSYSPPSGGVERVFNESLPRICDMAPELETVMLTQKRLKQPLPQHPRLTYYDISSTPRPARFWQPVIQRRFYNRQLDKGLGKVWHSTYYTLPQIWCGTQIVTVHDLIHERFPEFFVGQAQEEFRARKRNCVQAADLVICVSETTRDDVLQYYPIDHSIVIVIPNAFSEIFRPLKAEAFETAAKELTKPFILYVGGRSHYKNFRSLLTAYCKWPKRKEVDLAIVGRSLSKEELRLIDETGITEHIRAFSNISDEVLCELYNKAVMLVHTSRYEGFGLPILEAMASGCPIVASDIPSTREVAKDYPIYFVLDSQDSLIDALDRGLLSSKNIEAGVRLANQYSWDETAQSMLKAYRMLS